MFIKQFNETTIKDIPLVGGKNASLGEMITNLSGKGINVPGGFATTSEAFWFFYRFKQSQSSIGIFTEKPG